MYQGEQPPAGPAQGRFVTQPSFAPPVNPPTAPPTTSPSQGSVYSSPTPEFAPSVRQHAAFGYGSQTFTPPVSKRESFFSRAVSIPVAVCVPIVALSTAFLFFQAQLIVLGFFPLLLLLPYLLWLGSLKPDFLPYHFHSLLWGGAVAVLIAGSVNSGLTFFVGDIADEFIPLVLSAPIGEEIMKGLAVVYAIKRFRSIDSPLDGMIAAGWAAAGFTVIENVVFISAPFDVLDTGLFSGDANSAALQVSLVRNLTFFVHTVATAPIGYALGKAISENKPLINSWWGWLLAMAIHASWNGSLWYSVQLESSFVPTQTQIGEAFIGIVFMGFITAVIIYLTMTISTKGKSVANFNRGLSWLARNYRLPTNLQPFLTNWHDVKALRSLQTGSQKRSLNEIVTTLTRLGQIQEHYQILGPEVHPDRPNELELVQELNAAIDRNIIQLPEERIPGLSADWNTPALEPQIDPAEISNGQLTPTVEYHSSFVSNYEISPQEHSFDQHATQVTQQQLDQQASPESPIR